MKRYPKERKDAVIARMTHTSIPKLSEAEGISIPTLYAWRRELNLIVRSSEGTLRAVKNLCVGGLIEAVRDQTKTVDLKQINAVLMQPHWRHNQQGEPEQPILIAPPSSALKG